MSASETPRLFAGEVRLALGAECLKRLARVPRCLNHTHMRGDQVEAGAQIHTLRLVTARLIIRTLIGACSASRGELLRLGEQLRIVHDAVD